uniref:Uncharacterized protein n=1 Tax=Anopheles quadriannulatus TaxID=34691 RepID=A0A182X018_ANOQN
MDDMTRGEDKLVAAFQQENAFLYQLIQTAALVGVAGYWLLKGTGGSNTEGEELKKKAAPCSMMESFGKLLAVGNE